MNKKVMSIALLLTAVSCLSFLQDLAQAAEPVPTEICNDSKGQVSSAWLRPVQMGDKIGIAVSFKGTDDLHYYARKETAAGGFNLTVTPSAEGITFAEPIFPPWSIFIEKWEKKKIEVYVGDFDIFIPIESYDSANPNAEVSVKIEGIACTSILCLPNFEKTLKITVDLSKSDSWETLIFKTAGETDLFSGQSLTAIVSKLLLAVLAGISINILPCVLPIIPLIIMRLLEQSKESAVRRIGLGFGFCGGIVLFFAVFAAIAAIINISTGAVLDLNSLFRYPAAVIVLFLAIVGFGLVMLDVVTFGLPSSIAGRQGGSAGLAGSIGMGFFAGILSTPCSGPLLGFVLVWAQTQHLIISSLVIVLMGVGMALPYAIIILIPSLLNSIPKPGTWMEIFKKSTGFLLFLIAIKLSLAALPKERLLNVLTYGVIFSFCVWMWGKWVSFSTASGKKWTVRLIAVAIAVACGIWLLPAAQVPELDWNDYDSKAIESARAEDTPILIKFTADWCTNCKIVDKKVFHNSEIVNLIKQKGVFIVKADTTQIDYQATIDLNDVYGEAGNVPVTVVIRPGQNPEKIRGIFDKEQLIQILDKLPDMEVLNGEENNL